jgi:hypothetical protein
VAQEAWDEAGLETFVYLLYDSDKSGRSSAEQIEKKLRAYSDGAPITVELLAVTEEQIEDWSLPTRPAKEKGEPDAVELDAIPPDLLTGLVQGAIVSHIDRDAWEKEQVIEESERKVLLRLAGEEEGPMKGHTVKRGKKWSAVYDEGRDENERRVQRWRGGFETRREAQAFLTETLGKLDNGSYVQPTKLTLATYLRDEWLPAIEVSQLRPLTITSYESIVRMQIVSRRWLAQLQLQAVTPAHVKRLLGEMAQDGKSTATCQLARRAQSRA